MPQIHVFKGQDRVFGFTADDQGKNLPGQYGPWTPFKTIAMPRDEPYQGVDVGACLDDIATRGFHLTAAHRRITHLVPKLLERALVLGGGGAIGNAWEIGVIAGLCDAGLDVARAGLIVGTSAGSTVAAQVTTESPSELFGAILAAASSKQVDLLKSDGGCSPSRAVPDHLERTGRIIAAADDAADMRRMMGLAALEMDAASDGSGHTRWRATVAARLRTRHWPQRPMLITAVDARTGEPVVFDRHSGVDLVDAVAASTSSGFPYGIGDDRYIDGGYRRNENADLAAGYQRVLVLSPLGGRTRHPLSWRMQLSAQVEDLRAGGSRVETICPDSRSRAAFGDNLMDLSRRAPAAQAGYDQGMAFAERHNEFWC